MRSTQICRYDGSRTVDDRPQVGLWASTLLTPRPARKRAPAVESNPNARLQVLAGDDTGRQSAAPYCLLAPRASHRACSGRTRRRARRISSAQLDEEVGASRFAHSASRPRDC